MKTSSTFSNESKPVLGLFSLAMINIVAIASLRDLPQMAKYGWGSIIFYVLAVIFFFFPVSLIAAELSSGWPEKGGVYLWVKEALGEKAGFTAVFIQWFQNLCWYPVVLTFAAASFAFTIFPESEAETFAENKMYIVIFVLCSYGFCTFLNFHGLKTSAIVSIIGAFSGVIIPGILLIGLAIIYFINGNPSNLHFDSGQTLPDFSDFNTLTFAVSVLLAFAGMEMTAVHACEVRNPRKLYPLGISLSAITITLIFIFGALSISMVLAPDQYTLQTGVTEALVKMLDAYHLNFLGRIIFLLMAVGVVGSVNSWIIGPSKGLIAAVEDGHLPAWLCKCNKKGIHIRLLLIQMGIVFFICLVFTLQPTVASAYFMLSDLTIQLYLIMYILMFVSAIILRYKKPDKSRPFKIPLKNFGMWLISGIGIIGAMFAIIIGFFPPAQFAKSNLNPAVFVLFLLIGIITVCAVPVIISYCLKKFKF